MMILIDFFKFLKECWVVEIFLLFLAPSMSNSAQVFLMVVGLNLELFKVLIKVCFKLLW